MFSVFFCQNRSHFIAKIFKMDLSVVTMISNVLNYLSSMSTVQMSSGIFWLTQTSMFLIDYSRLHKVRSQSQRRSVKEHWRILQFHSKISPVDSLEINSLSTPSFNLTLICHMLIYIMCKIIVCGIHFAIQPYYIYGHRNEILVKKYLQ